MRKKQETIYKNTRKKNTFIYEQIKNCIHSRKDKSYLNEVFYKDARNMEDVPNSVIDLIVTSPPYFNIKDYSKDGWQKIQHSEKISGQIGDIKNYETYINELLKIWKECERVLKPNGKLVVNTPLMPMLKRELNTHYNRHIFDINASIQHSILENIKNLFLYDIYIWNRTNWSKKLMFGSYPYPKNFYTQNTIEFITVYVKEGLPNNNTPKEIKEKSKLTKKEWVEYTKQIWHIPMPSKNDIAFGIHPAIMPGEIARRCIKLFTYIGDVVLDPFAGSGTTLKEAKELGRYFVGYEICKTYKEVIDRKLSQITSEEFLCRDLK